MNETYRNKRPKNKKIALFGDNKRSSGCKLLKDKLSLVGFCSKKMSLDWNKNRNKNLHLEIHRLKRETRLKQFIKNNQTGLA